VKEGTGVRVAMTYVDSLVDLLENQTLKNSDGSIRMSTITGPTVYTSENGWFIAEFAILFAFEKFRVIP
jgi:hypothetical protein